MCVGLWRTEEFAAHAARRLRQGGGRRQAGEVIVKREHEVVVDEGGSAISEGRPKRRKRKECVNIDVSESRVGGALCKDPHKQHVPRPQTARADVQGDRGPNKQYMSLSGRARSSVSRRASEERPSECCAMCVASVHGGPGARGRRGSRASRLCALTYGRSF